MKPFVLAMLAATLLGASQSRVNEVQVAPAAPTIAAGQSQKLHAMAYDGSGNVIASGVRFSWTSNNVNVARVDSTGAVTAIAPGTATIRAEAIGSGTPPKAGVASVTVRR